MEHKQKHQAEASILVYDQQPGSGFYFIFSKIHKNLQQVRRPSQRKTDLIRRLHHFQRGSTCCSRDYLEVPHHDEPSGADPGGGEAGGVEDAVLLLLYHQGVAQQADQHHWNEQTLMNSLNEKKARPGSRIQKRCFPPAQGRTQQSISDDVFGFQKINVPAASSAPTPRLPAPQAAPPTSAVLLVRAQ